MTKVCVYCVPLEQFPLADSASTMATAASAVPNHEQAYWHFAAGFFYAGSIDRVEICEAGRDGATGYLVAFRSWRRDSQIMAGNADKVEVGDYVISRTTVSDAMEELTNLGKYSILTNNCQDFVQKLLAKLKVPFPAELITAKIATAELGLSVAAQSASSHFFK
nr:uncharacterized protein LOC129385575 isoform X2 [Dermacentor andersoni]